MTPGEFRASLSFERPPAGLGRALEALWHEANGDWDAAHRLAQADSGTEGALVHAYLHRREGDLGNAGYWYARAGCEMPHGPLDEEWERIAAMLLAGE